MEGFLQEARTIAHLEHPHIIRVLDFDVVDGMPYLVMSYAPNGNLRQLHPKDTILQIGTIVSYVKQITDALQYAHDQRLIHRDIKPENMLVGRSHDILLSDFGIALVAQSSNLQSTQEVIGTVAYMAPEQLQGKPRLASDQYALGVVVYEWLCGSRPFAGNFVELFSQHVLVPPPPLHEKTPNISPAIEQVVLKALAKEPRQRFSNVKEFAIALEDASKPKPILFTATPPIQSPRPPTPSIEDIDADELLDEGDVAIVHPDEQEDTGGIVTPPNEVSHAQFTPALEEDEDISGPLRIDDNRQRTSRKWHLPLPTNDQQENTSPPLYDLPAPTSFSWPASLPQSRAPSPLAAGTGYRQQGPVGLSQPRSGHQKTAQPLQKKRPTRIAGSTLRAKQPVNPQRKQIGPNRVKNRISIPILTGMLILMLLGSLALFVPTADVTLTLPSQSYSLAMKLTATSTSRQDVVQKTLPAQTLAFNTSANGTGKATGSTAVVTVPADGVVYFTNNGTNPVTIPTGTTVATKNNVLFITQAEVQIQSGQTSPTAILAQNPGVSGNVAANTITVIPPDSLTKIQQYNQGTTVNLTVTNSDPTQHGGDGSATTVTSRDVNAEKSVLDGQIQQQVTDYLAKNMHDGDQVGKPVQVETSEVNPAVGSVTRSGTFAETLTLHMTVLVVRSADLQAAAIAQMRDALSKQNSAMSLVPQQTLELKQLKMTAAKDGSSMALAFTAWGQVWLPIAENTVRNLIAGKSEDVASHILSDKGNIPNVIGTQIIVYPGFLPWLPFLPQRITVYFKMVPMNP